MNSSRLFTASRVALVVTAMSFAIRGAAGASWVAQFHLSNYQVGLIDGTAFWGFTLAIFVGGPLCDAIGMRRILALAFAGHLSGILLTIFSWNFWSLYAGTLLFGIANGSVEAACNPLIATLYPGEKTTKLNNFHVWFPGGIVIGGLVSYALNRAGYGWKVSFASMLLPLAAYGALFLGESFPRTERVEKGVSAGAMFWACLNPWFLVMVFCMLLTASTEFGPNRVDPQYPDKRRSLRHPCPCLDQRTDGRRPAVRRDVCPPALPLGTLLGSSLLAILGLVAMSHSSGPMLFASATVFAFGVCFFWPTMLGYTNEHFPKTGPGARRHGRRGNAQLELGASPDRAHVRQGNLPADPAGSIRLRIGRGPRRLGPCESVGRHPGGGRLRTINQVAVLPAALFVVFLFCSCSGGGTGVRLIDPAVPLGSPRAGGKPGTVSVWLERLPQGLLPSSSP